MCLKNYFLIDLPIHKGKRKRLVETLISKGITDKKVLNAILNIPRHFFMDSDFQSFAYDDKAFPILSNQTISQPYTVALQTELLKIKSGDKILEIGTGSAYQTSILIYLNAEVYTIERIFNLHKKSKKILSMLSFQPKKIVWGDGYLGLPEFGPFDKILVTAGASEIPKNLLKQLKFGGKMVIPIGNKSQEMTVIERIEKEKFKKYKYGKFNFVPMLKNKI